MLQGETKTRKLKIVYKVKSYVEILIYFYYKTLCVAQVKKHQTRDQC